MKIIFLCSIFDFDFWSISQKVYKNYKIWELHSKFRINWLEKMYSYHQCKKIIVLKILYLFHYCIFFTFLRYIFTDQLKTRLGNLFLKKSPNCWEKDLKKTLYKRKSYGHWKPEEKCIYCFICQVSACRTLARQYSPVEVGPKRVNSVKNSCRFKK